VLAEVWMGAFERAVVPVRFAIRRLRARPVTAVGIVIALAAAGALVGWSSLRAALAHEDAVRLRLAELPPVERSLAVLHSVPALRSDGKADEIRRTLGALADVTAAPRRLQVWHSERVTESGLRLALTGNLRADTLISTGRLPAGCDGRVCEALAIRGEFGLGQRVALGHGALARVVGRGSLRPEALPATARLGARIVLGDRTLLVRRLDPPLQRVVSERGTSVLTTAALDPGAVHAARLREVAERLRRQLVRLERNDPLTKAIAPVALLGQLADRGEVARRRLLLVAGQAAALILAFAAFAAGMRRRESRMLDEQMTALSGSASQLLGVRAAEALIPSLAGGLLGLGAVALAVGLIASERELPAGFVGEALPVETLVAVAGVTLAGALLLLLVSPSTRRASRLGLGALEVAALAALAAVLWQAWSTGALDPEQVQARGPGPVLLLLPALLLFSSAVVLLRVLPFVLRIGERLARRAPFGVRLGLVSAARSPAQGAATTTFLAVALGSALFSLDYRATLDDHARDEADFRTGAQWRASEPPGERDQSDVTPLTRYARAAGERPMPALRIDTRLGEDEDKGVPVQLLAVPAGRLPALRGWRQGFSDKSREQIARRLRPRPLRLTGPRLAAGATGMRVWIRADTEYPRALVLHLLRGADQRFVAVRVGVAGERWRRLRVRLPASARGAELVGVEFLPTFIPVSGELDLNGDVEFGPLEVRDGSRWSALGLLDDWEPAAPPPGPFARRVVTGDDGGFLTVLDLPGAPVRRRVRFALRGTQRPLIRPALEFGDAVPALMSGPVGRLAVDGRVTLRFEGVELPLRPVASSRLFPTIVRRPSSFAVVDYETLFAALNADTPGAAAPSEAWFFSPQPPGLLERIPRAQVVDAGAVAESLLSDPLAAGTRDVLAIAAVAAALLAVLGMILANRSMLSSERLLLAEYEALGIAPRTLAHSVRVRLVALSIIGVAAALSGAVLAVELVGALVAVTGPAERPLPPIEPVVAWRGAIAVIAAVSAIGLGAVALLAAQVLRETAARRLRA
jgi:hypothetical protein